MNYQSFQYILCANVQQVLGEDVEVYLSDVPKNNGIRKSAIMFRGEQMTVSPTLYMEDMYELYRQGENIEKLTVYICEVFTRMQEAEEPDLSFLQSFELAKKQIYYRLIHYERNRERLKTIPHIPYLDLAIVCYHRIESGPMNGAVMMIQDNNLELWNIEQSQLFVHAFANTPFQLPAALKGMKELLCAETECEELMYVLTNTECCLGAACILYPHMMQHIAEQVHGSFYILPSSIHECIIVPAFAAYDTVSLGEMVKDINDTHVRPEEILSDSVYYYDHQKGCITIEGEGERIM